jgi:serine/threonine-protein kinase
VAGLRQAGLLTSYQAEQLLADRPGPLRIGPYRLLARLGAGGGGVVYKAEHVLLGRVVALKVMKRRRVPAGHMEARTTAALSHPNIVAAQDAGVWRGRLVLALEYAEGIDMGRLVREGGPLPVPLAVEAARQALLALDHMHRRGLVHRDVKPGNLILVKGGESGPVVVKLLDLGLARKAGTPDRRACGTPCFLAPERGDGGPLDVRSDLWSLGCALFLLLTGQLPFSGDSAAGRLLSHKLDDPIPVRSLRPEVPAYVERLLARLLSRDPEQRPAGPAEALALLDAKDEPPPAPRQRRWPLLAAIVLGVLVGGAARITLERPSVPASQAEAARSFARVEGQQGDHPTLELALANAQPGAVITLHGNGVFRAEALQAEGLTLRAAPGSRPVLEAGGDGWEPMLSGQSLTLEGLTLQSGQGPAAMVQAGRRLIMRRCTLRCRREGPAVALRRGTMARLEDCRIDAAAQAVGVEAPEDGLCSVRLLGCEVRVRDTAGPALVLWRGGDGHVVLGLNGGVVRAGRLMALRSLHGVEARIDGTQLHLEGPRVIQDGQPARPGAVLWRGKR